MSVILDWNKYIDTAVNTVAEGIVMLRNENYALPLDVKKEVAVFGRIQFHYYKSGTGSGGQVNVSKVVNIPEGLVDEGVKLNSEIMDAYKILLKRAPAGAKSLGHRRKCHLMMSL